MSKNNIPTKVLLSNIWLFALLNYLYCDLVGIMDANLLKQYLTGVVNGVTLNQAGLLAATILIEIPIAMVLVSRVTKFGLNRILNLVAAAIMTIVQTASLFVGSAPTMYYIFCSILEIAATLTIFWISLKWKQDAE